MDLFDRNIKYQKIQIDDTVSRVYNKKQRKNLKIG